MSQSNQGIEAAHLAYVVDYLDCIETLPDCIQRHISELRRFDSEAFATFNAITTLREGQKKISESMSSAEVEILETKTLEKIQQLLIRYQNLSDEKLRQLDEISELIEQKAQQLEQDKISLDGGERKKSPQPVSSRPSLSASERFTGGEIGTGPSTRSEVNGNVSDSLSVDSCQSAGKKPSEKVVSGNHKRPKRQRPQEATGSSSPSTTNVESHPVDCATPPTGRRNGSAAKHPAVEEKPNGHSSATKEKDNGGLTGKQQKMQKPKRKRKAAGVGHSDKDLTVDPDEPTYCLCDQISYGDMIGCDNGKCQLEWFHFSCVGLTAKPKGKWYCPNCRGDKPNSLKGPNGAKKN